MRTQFSERLSLLMKERKISGQKIGDMVGKSQKTISRYANGEVEPSEEMKNKIFEAISLITGIEEDKSKNGMIEFMDSFNFDIYGEEDHLAQKAEENDNEAVDYLMNEFSRMTDEARAYYIDNFDDLLKVKEWEMYVLDFFHSLDAKKRKSFMSYLERFTISYEQIGSTSKLASYMNMVGISKKRPLNIFRNNTDDTVVDSKIMDEFVNKLCELQNDAKYHTGDYSADGSSVHNYNILSSCEFIEYSSFDWYFLLRIQIFENYEDDSNGVFWCDEYPVIINRKLYGLINSYL